jgi:hypothetical protein
MSASISMTPSPTFAFIDVLDKPLDQGRLGYVGRNHEDMNTVLRLYATYQARTQILKMEIIQESQ